MGRFRAPRHQEKKMNKQHLMLALVGATLVAAPALAQNQPSAGSSAPAASQPSTSAPSASGSSASASGGSQFISQASAGQWRASKLVGVDIYDSSNQKIGDVNEVLLDKSGKAEAVVIGVGGLLGVGQKEIALPFSAIQWKDEPRPSTAAMGSSGTSGAGSPARSNAMTSSSASSDAKVLDYPDHGVVSMTKEQLTNAPEFKYASAAASDSARPAPTPRPTTAPGGSPNR
jgi:sporulation protein YlmC with PRC-barrel domain